MIKECKAHNITYCLEILLIKLEYKQHKDRRTARETVPYCPMSLIAEFNCWPKLCGVYELYEENFFKEYVGGK